MNTRIRPTPPTEAPPLILTFSDARAGALSPSETAIIVHCEAAYHRGVWYVTVPAELWQSWPQREQVQA